MTSTSVVITTSPRRIADLLCFLDYFMLDNVTQNQKRAEMIDRFLKHYRRFLVSAMISYKDFLQTICARTIPAYSLESFFEIRRVIVEASSHLLSV
jgi:hypothetical protein